jgi:hypothetical protein
VTKSIIVEMLIAQGADVNARGIEGETALSFATKADNGNTRPDVIELLVKAGAKSNFLPYTEKRASTAGTESSLLNLTPQRFMGKARRAPGQEEVSYTTSQKMGSVEGSLPILSITPQRVPLGILHFRRNI